ncbi:MAG: pyruvate dehydrogenase complex dihydrolipoamide acetyltransferase [Roseivirga sp.]
MAEVIRMPKMSDTMEEGVIAAWLKKEGDVVKAGDLLAEVETDKATMELEAYEEGTLLHIGIQEKEAAPINGIIAIIGEPGEDIAALLEEATSPQQQDDPQATSAATTEAAEEVSAQPAETTLKHDPLATVVPASPLAKKMAQDKGYDLADIQGSGPGGRIIKRDVESFRPPAAQPPQEALSTITLPPVVGEEAFEDIPVSSMRKTIAKRLSESKFSAPHFYLTVNIAMDQVVAARPSINAYAPVKVSFNDIVIKAVAMALRQHPAVNVAWQGDTIRHNKHIHIGVAMAVEEGLLVPVVRFADNKSLGHIAAEIATIRQKVRSKGLSPQDMAGSTFTISNLGMLGVESFTAIVNPPAACILAVGEIKQVPVVQEEAIVPGHVMKATLSCDHRAVDGAIGAQFLKTFRELLEDPRRMLV